MISLDGRVAVVTGASSGLGLAYARSSHPPSPSVTTQSPA